MGRLGGILITYPILSWFSTIFINFLSVSLIFKCFSLNNAKSWFYKGDLTRKIFYRPCIGEFEKQKADTSGNLVRFRWWHGVFQVVFQGKIPEQNSPDSMGSQDNMEVQDALDVVKPRELTPIGTTSAKKRRSRRSWGFVALVAFGCWKNGSW